MRIVLSDRDLSGYQFPNDVAVCKTSIKQLKKHDGNEDVFAIVGSRAMSIEADKMSLPNLRFYQLTSAGFDNVPLESFEKKGIPISNAGTVYSVPIAETVVFGILLMAKKLRKNPNNRHFKFFRKYREITELSGKSVLIMGAGNIGSAIADRLMGFDMKIEAYDPFCKEKPQFQRILRDREQLILALDSYDYIISTMPGNDKTQGFIDVELFSKMKANAVIINVGRKEVFNQADLYNALKRKKLGGAVLDMFEKIPNPITNKFRRLRNVVVLPGVSAISREVTPRLNNHVYNNLMAMLTGATPSNVINGVK